VGYIQIEYTQSMLDCQPMTAANVELTPSAFQVLLALAAGEGHGYGVMKYVEELTDGTVRLPAGTLYRTIARLVVDGLVEESGGEDPTAAHDARRRYYRITDTGRELAAAHALLLSRLVAAAATTGLLNDGAGP
jgi:DNA-binding PadR family transcriptional regulator